MRVITYIGDQDARSQLRKRVRRNVPDVLLTTYDMCLRDNFFFEKRAFNAVIVDEGHRWVKTFSSTSMNKLMLE